jgi:hypothetical protein
MACFVAPATVAIITTVTRKIVEKKEGTRTTENAGRTAGSVSGKWTRRLGWLNTMLWGGTIMLVLDHILSGEFILQTREILVTGGAITAAVVVAWVIMVVYVELRSRAKRLSEV